MGRIQLDGISKAFGATQVIHDVNLTIEEGEFVVFVFLQRFITTGIAGAGIK